jgi:hypothetical protein
MTHVSNEMMMDVQGWRIYIPKEGMWINDDERAVRPLWDCIHDLNLVHEIEAGLSGEEIVDYIYNLHKELGIYVREDECMWTLHFRDLLKLLNADAQTCIDALYPILLERSKG